MIDRKALITRHHPRYFKAETGAPLSVGNGAFCFTADFTGLQSFPEHYELFPLCTMSNWGWHRYPGAPRDGAALRLVPYDTYGRMVGYATGDTGQEELFRSLRQNAHRFNLGRLGLEVDGAEFDDYTGIAQTLNLWEGRIESAFTVRGAAAAVQTLVRPDGDTICLRIRSPLVQTGKLRVRLSFPYGSHRKNGGDFSLIHRHSTGFETLPGNRIRITRLMDDVRYGVDVSLGDGISAGFDGVHTVTFAYTGGKKAGEAKLELSLGFSPEGAARQAGSFEAGKAAASAFWTGFWQSGGAIDLGESTDPRAPELERRIVLSQYLTAIQSRGDLPPAETGLTCNSWYGKFHLEMHYWHDAWYPLWNRTAELEKSMAYYKRILPLARRIAADQGYAGARWPKMCDPSGYNTPSSIAVLLIWQQPHPILLGELCYRQHHRREFLEEYQTVVEESAEFMLSFVHWDGKRYVLGPPHIPAQERHDPRRILNPGFEVEYFRWGLRQANVWRKRLGKDERADFAEAADKLAPPAVYDGVFPAAESCPQTYTEGDFHTDHPAMLAMLGMLPGEGVDRGIMGATVDRILRVWDLESLWGWDFPLMAMCAARLGRREDAIRFLMMDSPKNTWLPNGHNAQGNREDLPLYLPGNGGLLIAAAMMAAGWEGDDGSPAPGFPQDGTFTVKAENLCKYI